MKPCGLLLAADTVDPNHLREALDSQDAPPWDQTQFQLLRGVDLLSLVTGPPASGKGTVIALSSSGWWFRGLDDLAARLAALSGQPVLAVFDYDWGDSSGFYLALPGGDRHKQIARDVERRVWLEGLGLLVGMLVPATGLRRLDQIRALVTGGDEPAVDTPAMCLFGLKGYNRSEQAVLIDVMGSMLVAGACWKPGSLVHRQGPPPSVMRVIALDGPVRLPGPPRWAVANRRDVIKASYDVMGNDGWVCLAPQFSGVLAKHGAAVELLQFAPFEDGRWLGAVHPVSAVRIGAIHDGRAEVETVPQDGISSQTAFAAALEMVLHRLKGLSVPIRYREEQLRTSPDPAALLAWQFDVSAELAQTYLASRDPTVRLEVLSAILLQQPDGHGHLPT
tara:strand:- start:2865 stop:4040 length:1176 start_codon:yes stop_codon:yes gene_type:complete